MSHDHDGSSDTEPEPTHSTAPEPGDADDRPSDRVPDSDCGATDGTGNLADSADRGDNETSTSSEVDALAQDVEAIDDALEGILDPGREPSDGVIRHETFSGPIPRPDILQKYEEVLPGLADRIVTMAEADVEIRRERAASVHRSLDEESNLSRSALELKGARDRRAQYIAASVAGLVSILSVVGMIITPWAAAGFAVPLAQIAVAIAPARE